MKRFILVDSRIGQDKETKEDLLFLKLYRLPSLMKDGKLWHPRENESISNVCIKKNDNPELFTNYSHINPGALFDITFGVNDYNGKTFVATCVFVPNSDKHKDNDVYI